MCLSIKDAKKSSLHLYILIYFDFWLKYEPEMFLTGILRFASSETELPYKFKAI